MVKIDLGKQIIFNHTLDHIVGRTDHVISDGAGLHFGIHDFICLVFFINDLDTGFLFKHRDHVRI